MVGTKLRIDGLVDSAVDQTDRRILDLVRRDARISITSLSESLHVSKSAAKYRLDRLVRTGMIKYFALADPAAYGLKLSVAFHLTVEPRALEKVAEKLATYDEVIVVYAISNDCALIVHGLFRDNNHLEDFMRERLYVMKGIRDTRAGTIIRRYKSGHTMVI